MTAPLCAAWLAAALICAPGCSDDDDDGDAGVGPDGGDAQVLPDSGVDAGDGGPPPTQAVLHVDGDPEDATMFLTWSSYYCDDDCLWDVYAEYPAQASPVTVTLPDDPEAHFTGSWWTNPEPTDPTLQATWLVPWLAWERNGIRTVIGTGAEWLMFVRGQVPANLEAMGITEGWNAVVVDWGGYWWPPDQVLSLSNVNVPVNLKPNPSITLSGTVDPSVDPAARLAVLPGRLIQGDPVAALLHDGPLSDPWSVQLSGFPPEDHFVFVFQDARFTYELPVTYLDANASQTFDATEGPVDFTCYQGQVAMPVYIHISIPDVAMWYASMGSNPAGWRVDLQGGTTLPADQYDDLVLGGGCALP
jgi:hypothetical protein